MRITPRARCLIIAEAGVNHNGSLVTAKKMVRAAAQAGADFVKFQTFDPDELTSDEAPKARYQSRNTKRRESQKQMLQKLALTPESFLSLKKFCRKQKIGFLSTAFDFPSLQIVDRLQPAYHKVSSGDLDNLPFLRAVARCGRPAILSTGMGNLQEVRRAVRTLQGAGLMRNQIIVLQCHSDYPTRPHDANLRVMESMRKALGVRVGFSDHTQGMAAAVAAVALGACVLEKHFTLDARMPGPDHRASLEPGEFACMVRMIREAEDCLGDGRKRPTPRELRNRFAVRKTIIAGRKILRGEVFSPANLGLRRPASGLPPSAWDRCLGRKARKDFRAGTPIQI
jgi:N,N'-diacetyllegionaminate synthase